MTDTDQTTAQNDWAPCSSGEIQQMVRRERTRRTTKKLTRLTSATAVVAVLVIGAVVGGRHWLDQQAAPPQPNSTNHLIAGISCSEVVGHLPAYVNRTLDREDHELFERVFHHLRECRPCDAKMMALREAQALGESEARPPRGFAAQFK